jgi:hypothetical protein
MLALYSTEEQDYNHDSANMLALYSTEEQDYKYILSATAYTLPGF